MTLKIGLRHALRHLERHFVNVFYQLNGCKLTFFPISFVDWRNAWRTDAKWLKCHL